MPTLAELMAKKGGAPAAAAARAEIDARRPPKRVAPAPEPRELGEIAPGERVPLDYPPEGAAPEAAEWFSALHSFAGDLGVVIEPGETAEHAWLAVRAPGQPRPLLVLRLPLINRPEGPF
jgi:hypothetical protein